MSMEAKVFNINGEQTGSIALPDNVFNTKINIPLMHEVVNWYLANRRQGTHSAKTRAEVSGSGRKPWKQKGTGRARAGSIRSPLWRHGGVIFAKKPREFSYSIPKRKRKIALLSALSAKARDGAVMVLDGLQIPEPKTKQVAKIVKNLKLANSKILLVTKRDRILNLATRNLANLVFSDISDLTAYNVLNANKIVFTEESLQTISNRFAK